MFQQAVETSGLSEVLLRDGHYTVLAPSNQAFTYLNQWRLDALMDDPARLEQVVYKKLYFYLQKQVMMVVMMVVVVVMVVVVMLMLTM
jgi:hypothetical protein